MFMLVELCWKLPVEHATRYSTALAPASEEYSTASWSWWDEARGGGSLGKVHGVLTGRFMVKRSQSKALGLSLFMYLPAL